MGELVDDVQHPVLPSFMGAVLDEVVGPDVIATLRPQRCRSHHSATDAHAWLLLWNLQPLAPPDALHPLVIDDPAGGRPQKLCDFAVAVATITDEPARRCRR